MRKEQQRIVVVGGGIAGLAAGALAAEAGAQVTVLEQAHHLGGRARSTVLADCTLNLGPHALYSKAAGAGVLRQLGVTVSGASNHPSGAVLWGGQPIPVPSRPLAMLGVLLQNIRGTWTLMRALQGADLPTGADLPVARWLAALTDDPAIQATRAAVIRLTSYGNAPELLSARAANQQLRLALGGVRYLDGGWQALVAALAQAAQDRGVAVRTGAGVAGLCWDGAAACGVQLQDGTTLEGAVILAVAPAVVRRLLGERATLPEAAGVEARAACLDLVLSALPRPAVRFALGLDEPTYFSVHSDAARLGPADRVVLHVARYLAPGERADEAVLEDVMDRLQPGWRAHVLGRRFLPSMVVSPGLPRWDAARPGVVVPGVEGVCLAGDWVGAEGMLADAALASAAAAARHLTTRQAAEVRRAA